MFGGLTRDYQDFERRDGALRLPEVFLPAGALFVGAFQRPAIQHPAAHPRKNETASNMNVCIAIVVIAPLASGCPEPLDVCYSAHCQPTATPIAKTRMM
ncbi:MAG: hypothetical protein MPJ78_12355 [Hyphomicrobiaceae bacterium]|nr:hypothetical protein [Hyphomicrobiaceae bacterium]